MMGVLRNQPSGASDVKVEGIATNRYKDETNNVGPPIELWRVLKECPKFHEIIDEKKASEKRSSVDMESDSPIGSGSMARCQVNLNDDALDDDVEEIPRPVGEKRRWCYQMWPRTTCNL
jgi:hypothetical protein